MENFIHSFQVSPEVCDGLIEYHKTNTEYKSKGIVGNRVRNYVKESTDVTFFKNSTDPIIQQYLSELHKAFIEYTTHFKIQTLALEPELGNNIQYYPPGGGYKQYHWERTNNSYNRQLVYMTYLNSVDNGGTEWLYQELKIDAVKGLTIIWPADFAWTHKGIVSPDQEKWIATGWFKYD